MTRVELDADCPGCGKHVHQEKEIEVPVKLKEIGPSYLPRLKCSDGNCETQIHRNRNYTEFPKSKCGNCGSPNPFKENETSFFGGPKGEVRKCINCSSDDLERMEPDDWRELGWPEPIAQHHPRD